MAKRRLNKRFLIILVAGIGLAGIGTALLIKYRTTETPEQLITQGELALQERRFVDAFKYTLKAAQLTANDPKLFVRAGALARNAAAYDQQLIGQEVACWRRALEVDPKNQDALRALMLHYSEIARLAEQKTEPLQSMRTYAAQLLAADPSNKQAAAFGPLATIQLALSKVQVPEADIEAAVQSATQLAKEDPTNADLPFYLMAMQIAKGERAFERSDAPGVREAATKAKEIAEAALAAAPDDPTVHLRMGQAFRQLFRFDLNYRLGNRDEYRDLETKTLERAVELYKPEDPLSLEANAELAFTYERAGRSDLAEKVYRQILDRYPNEPQPRLSLGRLLAQRPETRKEAVEILSKKLDAGSVALVGLRARQRDGYLTQMEIDATNIRIGVVADPATPEAERTATSAAVTASLKSLNDRLGNDYRVLRLRGVWAMVQNNFVDATKLLSSAKIAGDAMPADRRPPDLYDVYFQLARAYFQTGNTGPARDLLLSILSQPGLSDALEVHFLLAQVYKKEGNREGINRSLTEMRRIAPGNPRVAQMEIALTDRVADPEAAKDAYVRLPESTVPQRLIKARAAAGINEWDESIRVLSEGLREKPGDVQMTQLLVQIHLARNNREEAKTVVAAALAVTPEDDDLQLMKRVLDAGTPEQLREIQEIATDQTPDECLRALRRARMAQLEMNRAKDEATRAKAEAEEFKQLNIALEKAPTSEPASEQTRKLGDAAEGIFNYHLRRREWPEAEAMLARLSSMNRDQARGLTLKYRMEITKGDLNAALATAQALTRELDQLGQSWYTLGSAYYVRGDYAQAITHYTTALDKKKDYPEAYRGIIDSYYRMNRPDDAKRFINDALRVFPDDRNFSEMALNHELQYGDPEKVLPARAKLASELPDDINVQASYAQTCMAVARARYAKGDSTGGDSLIEQAYGILTTAIAKYPGELALYRLGLDAATATSRPQRFEPILKDLAARDEFATRTEPQVLLADYYARMNQVTEAEVALKKILELTNNSAEGRRVLANFYQQTGRFEDGLKVLTSVESEMPSRLAAAKSEDEKTKLAAEALAVQKQIVDMRIRAGQFAEAEASIRGMLQNSPDDAEMQNLLTFTLVQQAKYDDAMTQIGKTLVARPDDPQSVYFRGLVSFRKPKGDIRAAITDFERIRSINPNNLELRLNLAECYRRVRDFPASISELQAAMRISPQNKLIRVRLIEWLSGYNPPRWQEVERLIADTRALPAFASDPDFYLAEANMWLARNDPVKAIAASQLAMRNSNNSPAYARQYLNVLINTRRLSQVMSETDQLLASGVKQPWVHDIRGMARFGQEDREGATREFDTAIELANASKDDAAVDTTVRIMSQTIGVKPAIDRVINRAAADYRWRIVLAVLYNADSEYAKAAESIESALKEVEKMTPVERENAYRLAGSIYLAFKPQPQVQKAADAFRRLLQLTPNDVGSLNNMAVILVDMLDPPAPAEALVYSQRAIELMQASGVPEPLLMDTHGWVLAANGRTSEAVNQLEAALALRSFPEVHLHLGICYMRLNLLAEARKQLTIAKEKIAMTVDPTVATKLERAMADLEAAEQKAKQANPPQ